MGKILEFRNYEAPDQEEDLRTIKKVKACACHLLVSMYIHSSRYESRFTDARGTGLDRKNLRTRDRFIILLTPRRLALPAAVDSHSSISPASLLSLPVLLQR
jgi:hypothetical protein